MTLFFARFSLKFKFGVLAVLAFGLFALSTYFIISGINESIDFANQETKGADFLPPVMRTLQSVQQHRGLSSLALGGKSDARGEWEAKRVSVDGLFSGFAKSD